MTSSVRSAASPAGGRPGWHQAGLRILVVLVALSATTSVGASKVKGRVENYRQLINPVWDEARDPRRKLYSFREIVPTVPAQYRRMFAHIPKELCIAALAASPQPPLRTAVLIRVGGGRTTPVTIVVTPQTRLQFKNTDPFDHRLYALKGKQRVPSFPPAVTGRGSVREWTVPEPGSYEVRDELAPSLRMWIVAERNVTAIGYPSMKGEFALLLEPGSYTLQAYFSGKPVGDPRPVTVEAKDLDLTKDPIKVAPDPKKSSGQAAEPEGKSAEGEGRAEAESKGAGDGSQGGARDPERGQK